MTRYPTSPPPPQAGRYGQAPRRPRRYQKPGLSPSGVLSIVLGLATVGLLIGTLMLWQARVEAEVRRDAKQKDNNDNLRPEVVGYRNEGNMWAEELRKAGYDGMGIIKAEAAKEPPEGAQHWQKEYIKMAGIRDQWANRAAMWRDKLSDKDKEWAYKNQDVFVRDKSVQEDGDDAGHRWMRFVVENRSQINLRGIVGRGRFYQAGRMVSEAPFIVDALDSQQTREVRVDIPESITGPFVFWGSIKAAGR